MKRDRKPSYLLAGVPLTMCATALEQWYSPPE